MKGKTSLLQSAATLVLACSTSTHGAFVPTPHFSVQRRSAAEPSPHPSLTIDTHKNIPTSTSTTTTTTNQIKSFSSTSIMSAVQGTETSSEIQEMDGDHLLLPYEDGSHGAAKIILSDDSESMDLYDSLSIHEFKDRLKATIVACKELKKKSLWLEVDMSKAHYIEACSDIEGLDFHHASGTTAHLSLWLRDDIECKIPEYATHQVGVGAIVVNSKDEILCVREMRRNFRPWKIPGGLAELGEQLDDAAIREIMEETGIECRFQTVLGFRHTHGMQFGRSDMYFVCQLQPVETIDKDGNAVIPEPVAQKGEIAATAWVPLEEYKKMINGENPHPMMQKMMSLYDLNSEENSIQRTVLNSIVPGRKPSPIYHAPGGMEF